jgi:hypothetical protein
MRPAAIAGALVLLTLAACGDSGSSSASATTLPTNCEEVGEATVVLVDTTFERLDALEATGADADTLSTSLGEFTEALAQLRAQSRALECKAETIDDYFCSNASRIQPAGDIAREMLADAIQATC